MNERSVVNLKESGRLAKLIEAVKSEGLILSPDFADLKDSVLNCLRYMNNNPIRVDEACRVTLSGSFGERTIDVFYSDENVDENFFRRLFVALTLVFSEFTIKFMGEYEFNVLLILRDAENSASSFSEHEWWSIDYALRRLPHRLIREVVESKEIESFVEYKKLSEEVDVKIQETNQKLSQHKKKEDEISKKLKGLDVDADFVALNKAFAEILKKKKINRMFVLFVLFVFGLLVVTPTVYFYGLVSEILFDFHQPREISDQNETLSFSESISLIALFSLPFATLTFIAIYFFRVVLKHFRELGSQIVQLELRKSLCEFIQSYADFSQELVSKNHRALDKFESLIFSNVVLDDEKLPSTYDGLEEIGKMIRSVRGGGSG